MKTKKRYKKIITITLTDIINYDKIIILHS